MEIIDKIIWAVVPSIVVGVIVGVVMLLINRKQETLDKEKELAEKELKDKARLEKEATEKLHRILIKGVHLNLDATATLAGAVKKLEDKDGKPLLNGEVKVINKKVQEFSQELDNYLIEKV